VLWVPQVRGGEATIFHEGRHHISEPIVLSIGPAPKMAASEVESAAPTEAEGDALDVAIAMLPSSSLMHKKIAECGGNSPHAQPCHMRACADAPHP
jgi:hypothetical protein